MNAAAEDERGLLAGLIFEPNRIGRIATELSPGDFVDRAHGELFAALVDLADAGTDIRDTHLVVLHCRRAGLVDRLGGLGAFHRDFIEGMAGTPGNAARYAGTIGADPRRCARWCRWPDGIARRVAGPVGQAGRSRPVRTAGPRP